MAHFIPCSGLPNAQDAAKLYVQNVYRLHRLPDSLVSDRGTQFTVCFWQALWKLLQSELRLLSAHHPQTDGQTERVNAILEQYLRCYMGYQQDNWMFYLPLAQFAYNNAVHSHTQQIPFVANFELPSTFKMHLVFHRVLLTKDAPPDPHCLRVEPAPPLLVEGEEEYEVEQILDLRKRRRCLQYLIHWKGYDPSEHSWETEENVHAPTLVREFHEAYPAKPRPQGKLDASSGFWQLKFTEDSSKLCTFNTPFVRYCFLRLPFGVASGP
ncbi:uncharacterized protein LOC133364295 [Rhineura floridana]|uniref:uncharacterized protein LOC133364295 n=1 Tax=Rhineura floridana TaxID=261503 RepID=UPI002AC8769D|nr:uncharacterized protein LOC133364295 [Rhineura floridana]